MDLEKELQALKDLRDKDLITEENFNTKQKNKKTTEQSVCFLNRTSWKGDGRR